jgi:hypothetical protein
MHKDIFVRDRIIRHLEYLQRAPYTVHVEMTFQDVHKIRIMFQEAFQIWIMFQEAFQIQIMFQEAFQI